MSAANLEEVADLRAQGMSWSKIGARYDASGVSAAQWYKRRTVPGWYAREKENRERSNTRRR
jgi:hypothetical protein